MVEIMAGLGIDAFYSADHLRSEEDVIDGNDFRQHIYSRLMIDAGIKVDVFQKKFAQRRTFQILCDAAITAPMVGNGTAAMRNDELQRGKILENVRSEELHERGGVAIQVVSARGMKIRIAGTADVDHGG